ncbi:phage tail tape measure protein [Tabrizicola sp.]|jgi:phage-related minor tail protein|uniref:phage tail tape measure protein n=1 Tax=Tabrizicola sp. TaxID=2005166 RepID=UPI000BC813B3|nr:phage tail tape measure protein [Tabrizicola sp.]MBY0351368.1 phage tail tape measure protein [Tabrizicola sp.]OYX21792.1 MAG: phage tail protein [Rhodobacterales bacterium 32-66-9]
MADIGTMQEQLQALEAQLGASVSMVAAFDGELARMRETMVFTGREVNTLSNGISGGLRKAFDGLVFDGLKLNDALKTVANTIVDTVYSIAVKPVTNALGGFLAQGVAGLVGSGMPFAKGGTFSQGKVMPFAKGGIVGAPTAFPMRGGTGLMGEAGPEAIMPLARGPDGRLGVQAGGGRAVNVVMNITTPDVQGFQRSQSQVAAQVSRALSRGQRNR